MSRKSFHTIAMAVTALVLPPLAASALEPSKSDQPEDVIISRPGVLPAAILEMTDEPGKWFKDPKTGNSFVVVKPGDAVLIKMSAETNTDHTITSLAWQPGAANFPVDQDKPSNSSVTHTFEKPGLYVFTCKVHPYKFGAVIVDDPQTEGLDVDAELQLITGAKIPTTSDIAKKLLRTFFVTTTPALWRDYRAPNWEVNLPELPINLGGKVTKLSDLNFSMPNTVLQPQTPGIGEVWADTPFEGVSGTQIDASNWTIKQTVKGVETNMNNPHNMWSDPAYKYIYQTEWFDKKLTTFDRVNGKVYNTQVVGENPSHYPRHQDRQGREEPALRAPLPRSQRLCGEQVRECPRCGRHGQARHRRPHSPRRPKGWQDHGQQGHGQARRPVPTARRRWHARPHPQARRNRQAHSRGRGLAQAHNQGATRCRLNLIASQSQSPVRALFS